MSRPRLVAILAAPILGLGLMATPTQVAPAQSAPTQAPAAADSGAARDAAISVRVGTFNVRTARALGDKRRWVERAPDVAREILARNPGVVALQELGPGRADGKKARLKGASRQTTSLTRTLDRLGGGQYRLVRHTSYVKPGRSHGTQGARILYDGSRFALVSKCRETTGKKNYHPSCAFDLPLAAGDGPKHLRSAAYARLKDRRTGRQFYVVSAHLDNRHSKSSSREAVYNRLRARQAAAIANRIAQINGSGLPVVFGGDINAWQTDRGRYAPHRTLAARGYRCASRASTRVNIAYPTVNHWRGRMKKSSARTAARLDVVMAKGARGFRRYENKMAVVDSARPSDHNLVLADLRL
ncbi:MAG: endonuclease/exonuclease/phosphatase family protein [Actinomycetes bacterium]